jgi:hypothetical protein
MVKLRYQRSPEASFVHFICKVEGKSIVTKKKKLEWKVGAKFKRPIDHVSGGITLTVERVDHFGVWALEDHLFTLLEESTLVEE